MTGLYTQSSGVQFLHELPRFGHGKDFAQLVSGSQSDQADYVLGILSIAFFILSIFIFWTIAIFTFRCMGRERVGLLAGRVRVLCDEKGKPKHIPDTWPLRVSFMILCCIMIMLGFALVGPGLQSLSQTSTSTRKLNRDVKDVGVQSLLILETVRRVRWNIEDLNVSELVKTARDCPNAQNNTFTTDGNIRDTIANVDREFEEMKRYLNETNFESVQSRVYAVLDGTETIDVALTALEKNDWIVRMFIMAFDVTVVFMFLAACASLSGKIRAFPALRCMTMMLFLPIFVVSVALFWMTAIALGIGSLANADFCTGKVDNAGPEGTLAGIFDLRGMNRSNSAMYTSFEYFRSQCATRNPIETLYVYEDQIQRGISSATAFLNQAADIGVDEITRQCGSEVTPIIDSISLVEDNLGMLLGALRSTFELVSCAKLRPIYHQALYGTACSDSSNSLAILFSILLGMGVVGTVMITLRAAMFPLKKNYEDEDLSVNDVDEKAEWEEYQAYLRLAGNFIRSIGSFDADRGTAGIGCKKTFSTEGLSDNDDGLEHSSTVSSKEGDEWQNRPQAYHYSPRHLSTNPFDDDFSESNFEEEERAPLSPGTMTIEYLSRNSGQSDGPSTARKRTPRAFATESEDEEMQALSPLTPHNRPSPHQDGELRLRTPAFLSPGTFRRWRRHDDEEDTHGGYIFPKTPQTPLVQSPGDKRGRSGNFMSPLTRDIDTSDKID